MKQALPSNGPEQPAFADGAEFDDREAVAATVQWERERAGDGERVLCGRREPLTRVRLGMVTIDFSADALVIHVNGLDKLWAAKSSLSIPLAHITGVELGVAEDVPFG